MAVYFILTSRFRDFHDGQPRLNLLSTRTDLPKTSRRLNCRHEASCMGYDKWWFGNRKRRTYCFNLLDFLIRHSKQLKLVNFQSWCKSHNLAHGNLAMWIKSHNDNIRRCLQRGHDRSQNICCQIHCQWRENSTHDNYRVDFNPRH